MLNKAYESLLHPDDPERTLAGLEELVEGQTTLRFENRLCAKDGSYHWISWNVARNNRRLYGVGRDITDRKHAQDALNRASTELAQVSRITALSAVTASIAHEVNQPLTGIVTNAGTCLRMLSSTPPNIDGACETVRRTVRDANRASDVITRLRALFSNRECALEPLDLNQAVQESIMLSSSYLQEKQIVLRSQFGEDLPLVGGDRIQLQQVILNLLRNASEAMERHTRSATRGVHRDAMGGRR